MNYFKHILLSLAGLLVLSSCINNNTSGNDGFIGSFDPDPDFNETALPSPNEDPYIIVNIDGKIIGCQSSVPENYKIFTEDASMDEKYSNIRISPDLKHILYAKVNEVTEKNDLVIMDISIMPPAETTIKASIDSNESEFIDNNSVFFTDVGNILVYDIGSSPYPLIPHEDSRCNHWAKLSPDKSKMVFKDQDPGEVKEAFSSWSPIPVINPTYEIFSKCNGASDPIDLFDSFYYCWRNNNKVIFKNNPGLTNVLWEKDTDVINGDLSHANILVDSRDATFSRLSISPDMSKLLLYGYSGLYFLNLNVIGDITGDIEAVEVYDSTTPIEDYRTKFVSFGSESKVAVVGTSKWLCIYNLDTVEKTNTKIESVFDGYSTLYALDCR